MLAARGWDVIYVGSVGIGECGNSARVTQEQKPKIDSKDDEIKLR
jgi:hypothetical protein